MNVRNFIIDYNEAFNVTACLHSKVGTVMVFLFRAVLDRNLRAMI